MKKILSGVSLIALTFMLQGCDDSPPKEPQIIGNVYKTVQECAYDIPYAVCVNAHDNALKETIQTSDKFDNIEDCMERYGQDGCATTEAPEVDTQDQHPGDKFIPKFQGFSVLVDYVPDEDEDGDETGTTSPVYGYSGYVYQPYYINGGYHPFIISGGYGYNRSSTTSIFTTRINNKVVASTGTKVNSNYVRPNISEVKASISRSGFGTRSFSASHSMASVSRGGFGGKAGGFGGGRGG